MKLFKVLGLSFMALVMAIGVASAQQAAKFAYVDLAKLFDQYEKTKAYDKVLEADNTKFQEERTKKIDSIRELQGKLAVLKDAEKDKTEKDIEKLKNEVLEFDRTKRTDLTKARDEKVREILLEIEKATSEYAKKQGITFVFNDRTLVYGDETLNITETILKTLNDGYKAPAAPAKK